MCVKLIFLPQSLFRIQCFIKIYFDNWRRILTIHTLRHSINMKENDVTFN